MVNTTKQKLWEERVQSFLSSGLSRRAWCSGQGIPEHQLNYWLRKLQPREVKSNAQHWVGLDSGSLSDTGVSLQVGDVRLAIKRGFDHQVLVDVIRALIAAC